MLLATVCTDFANLALPLMLAYIRLVLALRALALTHLAREARPRELQIPPGRGADGGQGPATAAQ